MKENMNEIKNPCVAIDLAVNNAAFIGDDGKVIDVSSIDNNIPPKTSVKQEIDYSTATKSTQFGASLAGNKVTNNLLCYSVKSFFFFFFCCFQSVPFGNNVRVVITR